VIRFTSAAAAAAALSQNHRERQRNMPAPRACGSFQLRCHSPRTSIGRIWPHHRGRRGPVTVLVERRRPRLPKERLRL